MRPGPRRTLSLIALASCLALALAPRAGAVPATSDDVRALAERASVDPAALQRLRSIDSVDGRPVDLASALADTDPVALGERLRTLSQTAAAPATDGESARDRAQDILSERRFKPAEPPRPFGGALDRLGDWLDRTFTDPIARAVRAFVRVVPGGATTVWILFVTLVIALVVFVAVRLARRRARTAPIETHALRQRLRREDPDELERRAEQAEKAGDLASAIRLRFSAGLLRLDRAGAISYDPSLTAGQVRRKLRSRPFDRVSVSFEAVAYGEYQPDANDVEASKTGWREVLEGVAA